MKGGREEKSRRKGCESEGGGGGREGRNGKEREGRALISFVFNMITFVNIFMNEFIHTYNITKR